MQPVEKQGLKLFIPTPTKPEARPLYIFYIDDSGDEQLSIFSALGIPENAWLQNFLEIKAFRSSLKKTDGIHLRTEFHATDFVAGRGHLGDRVVSKSRRCRIFNETLKLAAGLQGARLINVAVQDEDVAFERLLNRINKNVTSENRRAILICDEGKEQRYVKMARRMSVFNPVPSRYGQWEDGKKSKNIPVDSIIEDPFFKSSKASYMVQLADFCAYALLRRERPLPSKTRYGLDQSFYILERIMVKAACYTDKYGIVR